MAYGYRRRYSYRRYRPRRYVRRWFRRRMRRFVNGSSKSTVRVKVPLTKTFSISSVNANGKVFDYPISPWTASSEFTITTSPLYQLYCRLYDEVKCIGVKVILSIGTPIGTSTVPSATFVTAWDRRLAGDFGLDGSNDTTPTFAELMNYSSQQKATAVNNSIAKLRRSCYASDLMEKAQWHDCSVSAANLDSAYIASGRNPNFFAPGMWIGVSQTGSTAQTISMQADITYYFAFRNPKYGAGSSSKGVESRSLPVMADMEHEELVDDDMDADDLVDDILDMGANMSKNAAEGAAQRRAILKARRQQARDKVPVTKTL